MKRPPYEPEAFGAVGSQAYQIAVVILNILRGGVNFHDHVQFYSKAVTFGAVADAENTFDVTTAGLDWIPTYVMAIDSDNGGYVYASSKNLWTTTSVRAKSTKANTNATLVFF